jgi:hypothetical protein
MVATTIHRKVLAVQSLKTVAIIIGMVVLPFLIHLVPYSGTAPLGAILLPMYVALLAGAFYTSPVGLAAASLAAPLLNHFLTGMPALPNLYVVTLELMVFSLVVSWLKIKGRQSLGFSSLAFLFAKLVAYLPAVLVFKQHASLAHFGGYLTGLATAFPGILILLLVERVLAAKKS